mgnify:CR=1 FL=1
MSSTGQETEVHTYCDGQMAYTEVCCGQLMKAAGRGRGGGSFECKSVSVCL